MTADELTGLVRGCDPHKLAGALAPLSEAERKTLSKVAVELMQSYRRINASDYETSQKYQSMADLAVLGLCGWGNARRARPVLYGDMRKQDWVAKVLLDRRPDWLDKWVRLQLESPFFFDWAAVRHLVRAGACERPTDDRYIAGMIRNHAGFWGHREEPLADALRADPGLLECEIWQIFEADFVRRAVLFNEEHAPPAGSWTGALVTLADSGELDRARLLTASLQALNRTNQPNNAAWFCRFHEALSPKIGERVERQSLYFDLLPNEVPAVAGFSVAALKIVAQAGKLEMNGRADFTPVFGLKQKSHPLAALQVMRLVASTSPHASASLALQATPGLDHPSSEVQKKSVELIASLADPMDAAVSEAIATRVESVVPTLRPRLREILSKGPDRESPNTSAAPREVLAVELPGFVEIQAIPSHWRDLAGVDGSVEAVRGGDGLPPLHFHPMSVPRLDPSSRLEPIGTLDELIERASTAVERLESSDELELLMDAMSRFADRRPIDFQVRTAPLLKRVGDLLAQEGWWTEASVRFHRLVQAWLKREPVGAVPGRPDWLPPMEFVSRRMERLSVRLVSSKAGPLLASPTHKGGWLDPRQLVERLRYWQDVARETGHPPGDITEHSTPDVFDLIQALLRLAPDHRTQALVQAKDLGGEAAAALRFALGADERLGRNPSLWIAAARARDPLGTFPQLEERWGQLGPDAAFLAVRDWSADHDTSSDRVRLRMDVSPAIAPTNCLIDRPLALLARPDSDDFYMSSIANIRCCQAIWPANPDSCFADGAGQTIVRLRNPASTFSPLAPYLEPVFDPDTPFTEMAQLALATGLIAKDPGARQMAVDALIEVIADGRCQGIELGAVIGKLARGKGMTCLNRLPESLVDPSRVSPLHLHAVTLLAQSVVANLAVPPPKDVHHILSHLQEWLTQTNLPLMDACRVVLESVSGSGKTASLAGALLKFVPSGDCSFARAAGVQACRGRVERARRWAERGDWK